MDETATSTHGEDAGASRMSRAAALTAAASAQAGRAAGRRIAGLFNRGGMGFRDLAVAHVASTFGDTHVALALAGTLFFSVPSTEARGNVVLYLLLTVAPFALIGPVLGRMLDRRPAYTRTALVASSATRVGLAIWGIWLLDGLLLFPIAFGLMVLSRIHGIARNAMLPVALDDPTELVAANARLATISAVGGVAAAPVGGLLVWLLGGRAALAVAAVAFGVSALSARLVPPLPDAEAEPADPTAGPVPRRRAGVTLPRHVRLAQVATAVVRMLNGFLLLLLAFAFKDLGGGLLDVGFVLGAGSAGFAISSLTSPHLERRLREEPMVVAGLAMEAAAAFIAGQWFGLPAAAILAATAGFAWGTAKLAFDGLLQRHVPANRRGAAFTRSETVFQLAWVAGAIVPVSLPLPTSIGLVVAGLAALAGQTVYVSNLLLPIRNHDHGAGRHPG